MPLLSARESLADALLPLFQPETTPKTAVEAGERWAAAYVGFASNAVAVVLDPTRQPVLAGAWAAAFQPLLAGAGIALVSAALAPFWLGLPAMAGTVVAYTPNVLLVPLVGDQSTPQAAARTLASQLYLMTALCTFVLIPPATTPVPLQ